MFASSPLLKRRALATPKNRIKGSLLPHSELDFCDEDPIIFKVADNQCERAGAFGLVYQAYVQAGLMRPNVFEMRVMPHHLLATTATFVARRGSQVIGTVSLVGDGRLGLPLDRVYGHEVDRLRDPSTWLGEVSSLASAMAPADLSFHIVIGLMRLMAQFARRHGLEHLLVAVHPRHARFYRRAMGFKTLGTERPYPSVRNRPAVALHLDLSWSDDSPPASHENYGLFFGELIADEHLRFCPISATERKSFAPAVAYEANLTDAATLGAALACA
jgi:hypothetical protein